MLILMLYILCMTPPKRPIGKRERGPKAPHLGPYESGDPKGAPALRRSEKEGGRRPPEPSHYIKFVELINKSSNLSQSNCIKKLANLDITCILIQFVHN